MTNFINNTIKTLFTIFLFFILVLIISAGNIEYYYKTEFLFSNIAFLSILTVTFIAMYFIFRILKNKIHSNFSLDCKKFITFFTCFLFFLQIYIFFNIYFLTGWDVIHIRELATAISNGDSVMKDTQSEYFSCYPNNLLITFIYAFIYKINSLFGIFTEENFVLICIIINCAINSFTCFLVYKTALLFTKEKFALFSYLLAVFSFGLSPWSIIFYSDALGLLFPLTVYYLYNFPYAKTLNKTLSKASAFILGTVGYFIKPQCAIVLIAILFSEILSIFKNFKIKNLIKPTIFILISLLCFITISSSIDILCEENDLKIDKNKSLGMPHFFMMGLSQTRSGGYNLEDVEFSKSFNNPEERTVANLKESQKRIKNLGVFGYTKHLAKKMLTVFNDGTFAWGKEGRFYYQVPKNINTISAPFLKSIFYSNGSRNKWLSTISHMAWLTILTLSFVASFSKSQSSNNSKITILYLIIIGFILFEALFEVRARYVYIIVPIFCVLSAIGFETIILNLQKLKRIR